MTSFVIGVIIGLFVGAIAGVFIISILRMGDDRPSGRPADARAKLDDEFTTGYLKGLHRRDNKLARPPFPPDTKRGHRPYAPSVPPKTPDGEPPRR